PGAALGPPRVSGPERFGKPPDRPGHTGGLHPGDRPMRKPCLVQAARLVQLQTTFLTHVLPRVEAHGRIYFRHVKCPDRKEELLAEMCGLAWKWFITLVRRGKDVLAFVSALANYAARAVNSGRRVCGHERAKDVLSPVARRLHGFAVEALPQATSTSHEHLYASPHGQER